MRGPGFRRYRNVVTPKRNHNISLPYAGCWVSIMDWGMKNRLSRIIKPSTGHAVMLAVDHGYFMGPTHKLEEPRKTIEPLLSYSDAIMCTRGVLRTSIDPKTSVPIVLRVSGGASVIGETLTNEAITT